MSIDSCSYFDEVFSDGSSSSYSETPDACHILKNQKKWRGTRQLEDMKGRSKRYRPRRSRGFPSPPHKKIMFESSSPIKCQIPQETFFLTTPTNTIQQRKCPFWQKKKPRDSCFIVKAKEMKTFFKLTGKKTRNG